MKEAYAQIGQVALRDPADPNLVYPAIPIFARVEDLGGAGRSGLPTAEEKALRDVGAIFCQNMRRYIEAGGAIERKRREAKRRQ